MILGLHGKMGTGKSTIADCLISVLHDEYSIKSCIKSFALPVYQVISIIFDMPIEEIKRNKNTLVRPRSFTDLKSYRELLQNVGMELRDIVSKDIWVNALFGSDNMLVLQDWTADYKWWIIDDLRFSNEFIKIRNCGGKLIKIQRETNIKKNVHPDILTNKSEVDLDNIDDDSWDYIVDNNHSVDITKKLLEKYILTIL